MTRYRQAWKQFLPALAVAFLVASTVLGQAPPAPKPATPPSAPAAPPSGPVSGPNGEVYVHAMHVAKLGSLECSLCHAAVKDGSVELQRPGHDQCMTQRALQAP